MIYIHLRHTVHDYAWWREAFDNHAPARQAGGATGHLLILRDIDDPHNVTVILGWSDVQKARAFTESVSLQEALQQSGVIAPPQIRFLIDAG